MDEFKAKYKEVDDELSQIANVIRSAKTAAEVQLQQERLGAAVGADELQVKYPQFATETAKLNNRKTRISEFGRKRVEEIKKAESGEPTGAPVS